MIRASSSHSGEHLVNSPHAAGTLDFLEKIAEEADNENIEDDLITNDDDTKSEGECPVHFNSQRPVFSGGLTVSQTIPQKIKVKIWKHNSAAVEEKISKELSLGRISGPFENKPLANFKCSPLAVREKQNTGKYRLLHNLSYPYDEKSVNFNISKDNSTVSYATIKDAVSLIQSLSKPAFMAKTDISDAFRIIPLHPSQYHLAGFFWKGFYCDKCLPMGCSSSCKIFEEFSTALKWILATKFGIKNVVKILDDFLFIEPDKTSCSNSLQKFITLCNDIGVPLGEHKTVGRQTMLAYLPLDKLQKYTADVKFYLG